MRHLLVCTLLLLGGAAHCSAASVLISVSPSPGKLSPGGQASVQCSVQNADSASGLYWYRRQGNIRYQIGTDAILMASEWTADRYMMEEVQAGANTKSYKLTINDVKFEDSATIECQLMTNTSVASKTVIVCSDTSSTFCDCMIGRGWASPDCFTETLDPSVLKSAEDSWKSVVGLFIAFVVIVAYTLVIILIGKRESLRQCCEDEQTEEEQRQLNRNSDYEGSDRGQTDPHSDSASDSATCSTSDPLSSSGSDAQGSSHSNSSEQKLYMDVNPRETWKAREKSRRETAMTVTTRPEIHYNPGYIEDNVNQPQQPTVQGVPNHGAPYQTYPPPLPTDHQAITPSLPANQAFTPSLPADHQAFTPSLPANQAFTPSLPADHQAFTPSLPSNQAFTPSLPADQSQLSANRPLIGTISGALSRMSRSSLYTSQMIDIYSSQPHLAAVSESEI